MPEKKVFVVDTSVLIHDPSAITQFDDNDVVMPYVVLHELDGLRKAPNGRGLAAREAIRRIENLTDGFKVIEGVPLGEDGGYFAVSTEGMTEEVTDIGTLPKSARDDLVIRCAAAIGKNRPNTVIVSKDVGLRLKAMTPLWKVEAQDYLKSKIDSNSSYSGLHGDELTVSKEENESLLANVPVPAPDGLLANEFVYIKGEEYSSLLLCRNRKGLLVPVPTFGKGICGGIHPLDDRQRMLLDVLLDDDVPCVAAHGPAGSGKTLLATAAGMNAITNKTVEQIMYMKPIVPVGQKDLGFLPGDKNEKLYEWLKPVFDNLKIIEMYLGKKRSSGGEDEIRQSLGEKMLLSGQLEMEAYAYLRGRNIHGAWVVLDECQNTTRLEIRTAMTRMGEGTKCVLLADLSQIDNPYVDAESCGITVTIEALKGSELFAAVPLVSSQRSALSQLVTERMP
jgi:PhoH-like ATPase